MLKTDELLLIESGAGDGSDDAHELMVRRWF